MTFDEWLESRDDDWGADLPSRPEDAARLAWNAATKAEREECAGICDRFAERDMHPAECASAIRARTMTDEQETKDAIARSRSNAGLDDTLEMFILRKHGKTFSEIGSQYKLTKQAIHARLKKRFGRELTTKEYIAWKCGKKF